MSNVRVQMNRVLFVLSALLALASGAFMFTLVFGAVWSFKANPSQAFLFGAGSLLLAALVPFGLERFRKVGNLWLFPALYSAPALLFAAGALANPFAGLSWLSFGLCSIGAGFTGAKLAHHRSRRPSEL